MKTSILTFFFSITGLFCLFAQTPDLKYCGTKTGRSKWLKKYQKNPAQFRHGADTLLWVPLTIHVVGNDNGSGYFSDESIREALCVLNADFGPTNIQFYLREGFRYINSTAYNNHSEIDTGAEMMFTYNVDSTLNIYFVDDPAGNCGYNLPYAGIAMAENCSGPDDHTFAHEIGHAFTLPHPFLGWEGGQTHDGSKPAVYSEPAPEYVTYDYTSFQQVYYQDTLIIDTALVERADGSNCREAADGFCDTAPDYLAIRWICNSAGSSSIQQTDPDGTKFNSDGQLFMSYADDACSNRFTDEQIAAMRANLLGPKLHYLFRDDPQGAVTDTTELLEPIGGETVQFDNALLRWNAVHNASLYQVRINMMIGGAVIPVTKQITSDTFIVIDLLPNGRNMNWSVAAYSNSWFCLDYSATETFVTGNLSANSEIEEFGRYDIYPNPVSSGRQLEILVDAEKSARITAELYTLSGQLIHTEHYAQVPGRQHFTFPAGNFTSGIYYLKLQVGDRQIVEKVTVL